MKQKPCLGNLFILGDSYSTFEGHVPAGYDVWYFDPIQTDTDVNAVEQTWWKALLDEVEATLVFNCSWSGTTICNTGYNGRDCSDNSFIARLDDLLAQGFFEQTQVDTLFVFGGTNDSWAHAPIGALQTDGWDSASLFSVLPAVGYLCNRLKTKLPNTRHIFILNTDLEPKIARGITAACAHFGMELIVLSNIAKQSGHPNRMGMSQIKEQVLHYLQQKEP